jgi:sugar lactone lactonase YvrE
MSNPVIQSYDGHRSQWGEGPVWWNEALLYVDIVGHTINRLNCESGEVHTWGVEEEVGCVVPTIQGKFAYAGDSGFIIFDPETNEKTRLGNPENDLIPANRFNDGKCDPRGRFWAGSISRIKKEGTANLYQLDHAHDIHLKLEGLTNSNGICWSADHKIFYHIDTPTRRICAFDFNLETGTIANRRLVVDTEAQGFDSSPDGMTIDTNGNLWVAFCHGGCVGSFNPNNGATLERIELPCLETTACTFGGPKLDRLFVTTGIHKDIQEPDAGKVFVIDGLGVKGLPAFPYRG